MKYLSPMSHTHLRNTHARIDEEVIERGRGRGHSTLVRTADLAALDAMVERELTSGMEAMGS